MKEQIQYYQKRAQEYENIYQKPERQKDLNLLKNLLQKEFVQQDIIEIACGTGYWTELLAKSAQSILATDINTTVLEIAYQKSYPKNNVIFKTQDLKLLESPTTPFEGFFGGFIWSHIPKQELPTFLKHCEAQVKSGAPLIFIDNKYVEGNSTPISRQDDFGNSFQNRKLQSGETFEVIKNFPNQLEIEALISPQSRVLEWIEFEYYWFVKWYKD